MAFVTTLKSGQAYDPHEEDYRILWRSRRLLRETIKVHCNFVFAPDFKLYLSSLTYITTARSVVNFVSLYSNYGTTVLGKDISRQYVIR